MGAYSDGQHFFMQRFKLTLDEIRKDKYAYRTTQKYVLTRGECFREEKWVKALVKSYPSFRDRKVRAFQLVVPYTSHRSSAVHQTEGFDKEIDFARSIRSVFRLRLWTIC